MPKRTKCPEEKIDRYKSKIRRLQRKINEQSCSAMEQDPADEIICLEEDTEADTPAQRPDDWLLQWPEDQDTHKNSMQSILEPEPGPSTASEVPPTTVDHQTELDTEILEILGDDPSATEKLGPDIRNELADRLLHIAKEGLNKDTRKTLVIKYPVPANCVQIGAPKINLEIKAAITDVAIKRDKGIENKQKQMSSAIACLSEIINSEIISPTTNNNLLQKLMDINRLLCDIQHADSITRRNYILFALKNDMKEHHKNTKIDTYLFGENLADTLKSAKAVNKSGTELKAESINKVNPKFRGIASRPLNRKAPPQARRPLAGTAPPVPRSQEPALARAPYHQPPQPHRQPPHTQSLRTSTQAPHTTYPRRRY